MALHFLHIGKAGGSAIKHAINAHIRASNSSGYVLHKHDVSFADVIERDPDGKVFFVVRDPVTRFVSGFNSRLRRGQPLHNNPWSPAEAVAFARFPTANALAEGLCSDDSRLAAEIAIGEIYHTAQSLTHWLTSASFLEENRHRIAFVAMQESLSADFNLLRNAIGLPESVALPHDDRARHATPKDIDQTLTGLGEGAIREWYRLDYPILAWCRAFRQQKPNEIESVSSP